MFSIVFCRLSDTAQPVATEINLDAVAVDNDQFPGEVYTDSDWVRADSTGSGGFQRYRVLSMEDGYWVIDYQMNGGGTLITSDEIVISLHHRNFGELSPPGGSLVLRVQVLR